MGNSHIHRIQWIDCAKTMAMTAVLVDHCYFLLFFFQLRLISPFLISRCRFCNTRRSRCAKRSMGSIC